MNPFGMVLLFIPSSGDRLVGWWGGGLDQMDGEVGSEVGRILLI